MASSRRAITGNQSSTELKCFEQFNRFFANHTRLTPVARRIDRDCIQIAILSEMTMKLKPINPTSYNLFILLSITMHFIFPIQILAHSSLRYFGLGVIILGIAINFRAVGQLRKMQTSVEFDETPTLLVTDGPFRISRNPIYLGGVILLVGIAIFLGSLITFIFPVILFLALDRIDIPLEESQMEEIFGVDYIEYKQAVRRWV